MSTTSTRPAHDLPAAPGTQGTETRLARASARFGVAFAVCQLGVMVAMTTLVLPRGGSPGESALEWGRHVLDAADWYRWGNYAFMLAGVLLLGFLGVVHQRLRRADPSGILSTVALASGTLLGLVWPFAAILHDVALDTAAKGTDVRILAGWDAIAPYSLAFSALPRIFFVGAIVLALTLEGRSRRLRNVGVALLPLSLVGTATVVTGAVFPVLALSTLGYELWVGALAWRWLREDR
ncbi:hypothetical protein [Nocardioides taihuensis]|uniref:DUF4386 family protein n=1 Tax=Nocardioides taihuensis TaxID=1835606 RepID=A0ABW0BDG7_9ACTN